MNATAARIELLSSAIRAIAAALPKEAADRAARDVMARAAEISSRPLDEAADVALAAELAGLLGALGPGVSTVSACRSADH